jgi:hypothetical protein
VLAGCPSYFWQHALDPTRFTKSVQLRAVSPGFDIGGSDALVTFKEGYYYDPNESLSTMASKWGHGRSVVVYGYYN